MIEQKLLSVEQIEDRMTVEYARSFYTYHPETGFLYGKSKEFPIGSKCRYGYLKFLSKRKEYKIHRVAWMIYYGEIPDGEIDHINGIKDDNRIDNLRVVNRRGNAINRSILNSKYPLGVTFDKKKGKYLAQLRRGGNRLHIGYYDSPEEAHDAYMIELGKTDSGSMKVAVDSIKRKNDLPPVTAPTVLNLVQVGWKWIEGQSTDEYVCGYQPYDENRTSWFVANKWEPVYIRGDKPTSIVPSIAEFEEIFSQGRNEDTYHTIFAGIKALHRYLTERNGGAEE